MKTKITYFSFPSDAFLKLTLSGIFILLFNAIALAQFTPLIWQSEEPVPWNRDKNQNRIDDLLDDLDPDSKTNVVIDLKECLSEDEILKNFGHLSDSIKIGKFISFVHFKNVLVRDLYDLDLDSTRTAMIELAVTFQAFNDISVRSIKARSSSTYSPSTVEDAFPGIDGSGVNIAIMDTGVDDGHESFPNFVAGYNGLTDVVGNPDDDNQHGTHVAGTALGTGGVSGTFRGVAPGAGLVDVKVLNALGSGSWTSITNGLEWIIENRNVHNIRVVNMSLGSATPTNGVDAFSQLVNYAVSQGLVVAVAAGNSGPCSGLGSPAAASQAITVAAVQINGTVDRSDDVVASFSKRGPRADDSDGDLLDELKPEIAAPGASTYIEDNPNGCIPSCSECTAGITSAQFNTVSGYTNSCFCGTSMATPHVAGVAALIIQSDPLINTTSVKEILIKSAEDVDLTADLPLASPIWNDDWGYGYLDAFAALSVNAETDVQFPSHPPTPGWLSPDLTTATIPITEGIPNTMEATIRNDGNFTAVGVIVDFGVYIYSAGIPTFYDIGTQVVDIPGNTTIVVQQSWTPMGSATNDPHACMKVEIGFPNDTDFGNNSAQRNIHIVQTNSPATVRFQVNNTLGEAAEINIIPNFDSLPGGWDFDFSPRNFQLMPEDCGVLVEATFFPPTDAEPGEIGVLDFTAMANTPGGNVELGGVRAMAVVALPGNLGDLNNDMQANSTDALIVLSREIGGIQIPLRYPVTCGDVNEDGKVNSTDALIILSYDAEIDVPFPILEIICSE